MGAFSMEEKLKTFYWIADRSGCAHYRCVLPGIELANRGHHVAVDHQMPQWVREGGCDVVVAQRTCMPGPTKVWQEMARAGQSKLVFEIDDDLLHVDPSNRDAYDFYSLGLLRGPGGTILERDIPVAQNLIDNITVADLVTVTTEPLADLVAQWNRNVVVLPNMIRQWMLEQPMPNQDTERVTIGWAGSPTHDRDFGEVAKPLKRVLQRFGAATEFHCMGADYTARVASRKGRTRFTGWVHGVGAYLQHVDFHIGIAPLRPSTFTNCKSDLKLLEYAALGIPAVVSDTGPYARAVAAGAPARTAVTHREWEQALVDLIQSPADREQLGKEAREWASTRTIEANAWRWEEAYQS
ncbi:glycosyltransferase [Amycolatopsis sp. NPDC006131]|uniref:glycosyltransferase n=1 Tax=Amycolatopsis sp. NPDC006131 TaxID=3156731 RepID=UPI0033B41519